MKIEEERGSSALIKDTSQAATPFINTGAPSTRLHSANDEATASLSREKSGGAGTAGNKTRKITAYQTYAPKELNIQQHDSRKGTDSRTLGRSNDQHS